MLAPINHNRLKAGFVLLLAVMLFFPLFIPANSFGGSGLDLAFNLPSWVAASWIIVLATFTVISKQQFVYPAYYPALLIFPLIMVVLFVYTGSTDPVNWFFREAYILLGLLFLFACFQFSLKTKDVENILYIIVGAGLLYAVIGVMQLLSPELLFSSISQHTLRMPFGIFRQINVQVTFLGTGVAAAIYLVSRPSFNAKPAILKLLLLSNIAISTFNILVSGSRIGLIALIISVILLLISRRKQFAMRKVVTGVILVLMLISAYFSQSGLSKTFEKSVKTTEETYSDSRLSMYQIGVELVMQKPFTGHGIGSFESIWSEQAADFVSRHPDASLPLYPSHPHNELLYWMIEGGVISLIGLMIFAISIMVALWKCGLSRGGAYLALLMPISLHTQVELPFYISSIHWFVWLLLISLPLSHQLRHVDITWSHFGTKFAKGATIIIAVLVSIFMYSTYKGQEDIHRFMFDPNVQPPYLNDAFGNIYLRPMATEVAMRSMLYNSVEHNDIEKLHVFSKWAEEHLLKQPQPKVYEEWILAESHLGNVQKACDITRQANRLHPNYEPFIVKLSQCQ